MTAVLNWFFGPQIKGFTAHNIKYIHQWFMFWIVQVNLLDEISGTNVKQLVSHLSQITFLF
jgi:hypothetical protein